MNNKTSNVPPPKLDRSVNQVHTNNLDYDCYSRYGSGLGIQPTGPESRPSILLDMRPNYYTKRERLHDKSGGVGHIKEMLKGAQRQTKPEQKRFRYTDDFDGFTELTEERQERNSDYSYGQKLGKTSLKEMPLAAKQIYVRIPPKSYVEDAGKNILEDQDPNTKVEGKRRGVHLGVGRDTSTGRIAYEKPRREEYVRMDRTTNTRHVPSTSSETDLYTNWKDQQLFLKQGFMVVEKAAQASLHKPHQYGRPLQRSVDQSKSQPKLKKAPHQTGHSQKMSPISAIPKQPPCIQGGRHAKQVGPKRHLRYNSFESTRTSSLNECKTTDHSSENYAEGLINQKLIHRQARPEYNHSHEYSHPNAQETRMRNVGDHFDKENRQANLERPNVSFSRKLNEYEDQALRKIQTINELNTKIGERIKNILRNFDV